MLNTLLALTSTNDLTGVIQAPVNTGNDTNVLGFIVATWFALITVAAYFNDMKPAAAVVGVVSASFLALGIFANPTLTIDTPAVQSQIAANTGVVLNTDTLSTTVFKAEGNVGDQIAFTDGGVLGSITVTELSSDGAGVEYRLHQ